MDMYTLLHGKWITNKNLLTVTWSLDERGVWGGTDTCVCMAESLSYSPESAVTLLIGYTPIQNKKLKKKGKKVPIQLIPRTTDE